MILPEWQFVQIVNVKKNNRIALSTGGCQTACIRILTAIDGYGCFNVNRAAVMIRLSRYVSIAMWYVLSVTSQKVTHMFS